MKKYNRIYNFSSGPSQIPVEVLEKIKENLLNFNASGMSIMEMNHYFAVYKKIHNSTQNMIKDILNINNNYDVLLLQGGSRLQFSMIPLNFCKNPYDKGGYVVSGIWSEEALNEAIALDKGYNLFENNKDYTSIPVISNDFIKPNTSYIHITSNNTIIGTQYHEYPSINYPLIADMTSDIFTKNIDINKFDMVYASAQKNIGISGITVAIIKKEKLKEADHLPSSLSYHHHLRNNSMLSTPPTFNIYVLYEMLKWIKSNGGIDTAEDLTKQKAKLIYDFIDSSNGFYMGMCDKKNRSNNNITFNLYNKELQDKFLEESIKVNIHGILGHYLVGGFRVANYTGINKDDIFHLLDFMNQFMKKYK
ncbi:3-phosphoserine/phosphohydroxythreonine transaminase [Staphylococcus pseudintermedius]|uniref:3-phosphoserine/phosphohydroxythreonine transaminase n=1 Tax=Staphylococcus pseudintermedius TaxID=283734 RepID=UPI0028D9EA89|nr:3-phosphoserine/phosphohydroxythreonine transaminase [Staphylococcus pseudintermedius]ELJ9316158.1 3-phosphoserine/phosphohydroxythreonine transaminase [Staphylococcus pseudintermedius]WQL14960.1 3-phosphoserine/phosphohydroxythreonine transaminase [Staphylococcus pseudintermedius]